MRRKGRRGFSLIELAMVLGISGLMVGFVLQSKQEGASFDCSLSTKTQLRDINGAIERFARNNSRLPLPAARNIGVEAVTYGREASGAAIDTAGTTSWGALPFQALGLAPSYASDCWGNKFTYVVTTALTTSALTGGYLDFSVTGSISVRKDASTNISTTNAYAVISHGEDGLGAVKSNYAGAGKGWCGGAANLKSMNCLATSATLANATTNNGKDAGANYFDDLIVTSGRPLLIVNGACNNSAALGCAAGTVAVGSDNGLTACNTTRTWVCNGANGGSNSVTCSFANPVCAPCASTSLTWGIGCSAVFPATVHSAVTTLTPNTNPTFTTVGSFHYASSPSNATAICNNGVFGPPSGTCVAQPPPVVGACNNSVALGCAAGTAISDNGQTACNTTRTWACQGSNGGANSATCSLANAACAGCTSASRGWGAGCTAVFPTIGHGATSAAQSNTNPSFTGSSSATISCSNGTYSTPSGTCTPQTPVNGSCNNAAPGGACAAGSSSGDNGATSCGTTRTWNCVGAFGGSTASCSRANATCDVFNWDNLPFGACSGACGGGAGTQTRGVHCYQNGVYNPDQSGCYANVGGPPPWSQACTNSTPCPVFGQCGTARNSCNVGSAISISCSGDTSYWVCSASGGNSGTCTADARDFYNSSCGAVGLGDWGGFTQLLSSTCGGPQNYLYNAPGCCHPGGYQGSYYNVQGTTVQGCNPVPVPVNGQCDGYAGQCVQGTPSATSGCQPWGYYDVTSWSCYGANGGSTANCGPVVDYSCPGNCHRQGNCAPTYTWQYSATITQAFLFDHVDPNCGPAGILGPSVACSPGGSCSGPGAGPCYVPTGSSCTLDGYGFASPVIDIYDCQ